MFCIVSNKVSDSICDHRHLCACVSCSMFAKLRYNLQQQMGSVCNLSMG